MKLSVSEMSKLTGVSVRTLHYYDQIDLLKPAFVDGQNGYRYYDESSLERLQEILFYRELDFELKTISGIITSPDYNKAKALSEQKHLLTLKKQRLERLIDAIDNGLRGEYTMKFNAFDNSEYEAAREKYAKEASEKWGNTDAYKESEKKTSSYSKEKWNEVNAGMDSIMEEFAECMKSGEDPSDKEAQLLVEKWQNFITENYYKCTNEILAGLGQMYTADDRFRSNIDSHGDGTAEFMSQAISTYCR